MIPALWAAALVAVTLLLLLLPLLPGLAELYLRRDAAPLRVIAEHDRDIRRFARSFRGYVREQLLALEPAPTADPVVKGLFPDGTHFLLVQHPDAARLPDLTARSTPERSVVVVTTPFSLPQRFVSFAEVYALAPLDGYGGELFRGLLGEADLWLGAESMVLRWVHAEGNLRVGPRSQLFGRASAEGTLRLNAGCRFEWVYAPVIEVGRPVPTPPAGPEALPELPLPPGADRAGRRCLVHGDLRVPAGHRVPWELVVRGDLVVEEGARLDGNVKSTGDLWLEDGVRAGGSLIAAGSLVVGRGCPVAGPLIAEGDLMLGAGSVVGEPARLTTVSAPRIWTETGVVVHGALWARRAGWVGPFA